MTEPLPPLSDEDLSAALDGVAGADVVARLETDPSAQERLDALRNASQAIGQAPAEPGPEAFDALIARAIEVGTASTDDTGSSPTAPTSSDGVVTPMAPRRRTSGVGQRWLVAAFIVALVGIGLGLVYAGTHDNKTQTTAADVSADLEVERSADDRGGDSAEPTSGSAETTGDMNGPSGGDPPSHFEAVPPSDPAKDFDQASQQPADLDQLGTFADARSLREALRDGFPPAAPPVVGDRPTNVSVDRCNGFIQTVLEDFSLADDARAVGYATVDGDPYLVYEFPVDDSSTDGSALITVAEPQTCDLLFTFVR